jgi:hypothetical protein
LVPSFDPSRLSDSEREAYLAHVDQKGHAAVANLFSATLQTASMLQSRRFTPEEIAEALAGKLCDTRTAVLLRAMARQAIELSSAAGE